MADPLHIISSVLASAFAEVTGLAVGEVDPVVRPSEHADAQANGALALAKRVGQSPRQLAQAVVDSGVLAEMCSAVEVAGPGFINLTLAPEFLARQVDATRRDPRLGVRAAATPQRVVVDYSAPNVAKEMHVGHLRSTVIGDALVRMLTFVGHDVVRENHIGDWGTPFGMLIEYLVENGIDEIDMSDPNPLYQAARARFDTDDDFKARARERVVKLQQGDPATRAVWQRLVGSSVQYFGKVYRELGVLLTDDDVMGESAYDPLLPEVIDRLRAAGLLQIDDGAGVVFPPGFKNREGEPLPLIVQKRDGGFNYGTSDLACVMDRVERVKATLLLYVVGAEQQLHLSMVFAVADMAGWLAPPVHAEHVVFGKVLGEDRKMFRTRSGDSVKLQDLLSEAIARGTQTVIDKGFDLTPAEQRHVGHHIGIGAVKYFDLSTDRIRDYVFDWDRMLSFEGNTGPYLQYAHARICSIFRKAEGRPGAEATVTITDTYERALALQLLHFDAAVHDALDKYSPHRLCTYLFELAQTFSSFYEHCPVVKAPDAATRASRLALCDLTARTLKTGLGVLGIDAPEKM